MIVYVNGRGMNAPELKAYISELEAENEKLKRYLREAISGFRKLGVSLNDDGECDGDCLYCPINNHGNCLKWEYESEALALIGEEGERNG
jgi:hypothetical protein